MNSTILEQAGRLIRVADDAGMTAEQLRLAVNSRLVSDVFEAAKMGTLTVSKRVAARRLLGLQFCEFVTQVKVSAVMTFAASDSFRANNTEGVRFSAFNEIFTGRFLGGVRYVETNVPEAVLRVSALKQPANDREILEAGIKRVFLAYLWALLKRQPMGECLDHKDRALLANGLTNVFEIGGTECAVAVSWYNDGWDVNASHISSEHIWLEDCQVFTLGLNLQTS